jgi:hypothetical protein
MADLSNVTFDPQNPNALFSPDQWLNQFSNFNSKPLPWPSTYAGYPTDAMGNPIGGGPSQQMQAPSAAPAQPAPGTTINSTPAAAGQANYSNLGQWGPAVSELMNNYQAAQAKLSPQQLKAQADTRSMNANQMLFNSGPYAGPGTTFGAQNAPLQQAMQGYAMGLGRPQQAAPQQAAPPPAPAAPGGLTYPQVLALLANPGKVTTPGANVPVGPSSQPGGGVNNAFLGQAQGKPGMNTNFLNALAALQNRGRG